LTDNILIDIEESYANFLKHTCSLQTLVMQYARSIVAVVIASLCVSLLPYVHAQAVGSQVSPFDFQLDESAVDGKRYSYVIEGGSPAAIIKQNETKSLPVIILPATDKPVPVKFHLSVGYDQTGPIQMPLGVHAIVDPSEITVKPHHNETLNIVVSVDKNAPSGKYQLNIVGEWPGPNGFLGSSIIINVGKDYGPDAMPFNAMWTPLKQYQSGKAVKDIQCNQDLHLVIKSEDGTPACVKLGSINKLVSLHWALKPANELTIEEFKDAYKVGEKIDFAIKFKGFRSCSPPSFMIKNAANKTIWESPIVLTLCDPDIGYGESKWKFGELYSLPINQTGSYAMDISVSDKTLEKGFFVIQ